MNTEDVIARLGELRQLDAPTHGGRVMSYVYDSGMPELDDLARTASDMTRALNGLDPTTFPSIARMERDLVTFAKRAFHGDRRTLGLGRVVGTVTSGGTESCLLAVKTARDLWRARVGNSDGGNGNGTGTGHGNGHGNVRPRLVAPATVHAAFHKAAQLFDLECDLVPCEPDGSVRAEELIRRLGDDVALVVVSAPAYPSGALDPVREVSQAAAKRGISCHVDACFGGFALPWWPGLPAWDFRLPGVTSLSADLHKFGYAPKGVSVLLHRGRARHRAQSFALTNWPGYPVVNPTLLGSKSASPLAAAWAIVQHLEDAGFADLTAACVRAAEDIVLAVGRIEGLAVQGTPRGPALALVADATLPAAQQVDPHHLADEVARRGFKIQHQPGVTQRNGVRLPHSAHLTITPVTERNITELLRVLEDAAAAVRGRPQANPRAELTALKLLGYAGRTARVPGPAAAWTILRLAGAGGVARGKSLPGNLAPMMALIERLPEPVARALLVELLARASEA